jgi:uncharacterized protein YycO
MKLNNKWFRLLILPIIGLLVLIVILLNNINLFKGRESITFIYLDSLRKGNAGYGQISEYNNNISLSSLKPGDILLGGWPDCAYGAFSHAGLYLGNGEVLEGYVDSGITINSVEHYKDYAKACILRVQTSEDVKKEVIKYARKQEGKIFYPVAFKSGERYWNCSKIIWKSYMEQNIDLDNSHDLWIAPVVFYNSPYTKIIGPVKGEI